VRNVVGPVKLTTQATDVSVDGFSDGLDLTVDRGDIDIRTARLPLGKISVHTRSGNIDLALPQAATFALTASTDHGEIDNEFGEALKQRTEGQGARLEGAVGSGPGVNLITDRGSITVRKSSGASTPAPVTDANKPVVGQRIVFERRLRPRIVFSETTSAILPASRLILRVVS